MPTSVRIDRIDGASIERLPQFTRAVRVAYVEDIPTTNPEAVQSLALRAPGLPQLGDRHPTEANCRLVGARVFSPSDSQAMVYLTYETPRSGGTAEHSVVTESTSLIGVPTQLLPGTWQPISVRWSGAGTYTDAAGNTNAVTLFKNETATVTHQVPIRVATFAWPRDDEPSAALTNAIGTVNKRPWRGLPEGHWLFNGLDTETHDRGNSYAIRATFITKVHEDWSTYAVLRQSHLGKFITVDAAVAGELRRRKYAYGVFHGGNGRQGITKIGGYLMTDFTNLIPRSVREDSGPPRPIFTR